MASPFYRPDKSRLTKGRVGLQKVLPPKPKTTDEFQPYVDTEYKALKKKIWKEKTNITSPTLIEAQQKAVECLANKTPLCDEPVICEEMKHLIMMGYKNDEIEKIILEQTDIRRSMELDRMLPVMRAAIVDATKKYLSRIYDANIEIIFGILYRADRRGDDKTVLQAVDMLNKMASIYTQKVEVKGAEPIILKV